MSKWKPTEAQARAYRQMMHEAAALDLWPDPLPRVFVAHASPDLVDRYGLIDVRDTRRNAEAYLRHAQTLVRVARLVIRYADKATAGEEP